MRRLQGSNWLACRYAVLGVALLIGLALPSAAHAALPGANGRIAWASNEGGSDLEIVTAYVDGSGFQQVTTNTTDDREPAWSPDGTKIAYSHFTGSFWEIWIKDLVANTNTAWVTSSSIGGEDATDPTWNRDGSRIAFTRGVSPAREIWRADTSAPNTNVTPIIIGGDSLEPAYAPNSNKIAFSRRGSPHFGLQTINDDGTSLTPLVSSASFDLQRPNWSPDGAKLAYTLFDTAPPVLGNPPNYDLWTINANGSGAAQLFYTGADELDPAWAPEGNMIAYERAAPAGSSDTEIYTVNLDGSGSLDVATRAATSDAWPDWQPVVAAQARPKGASPLYLSLVPAFNDCTAPNANHDPINGTPFTSCVPPKATSTDITVGEPQVNGQGAGFVGSVSIKAISGDARFSLSATDVRCAHTIPGSCTAGPLSDYTGTLQLAWFIRISDRSNPAGRAGTVQDALLGANLLAGVCTATSDPTIGSTCAATSTYNAVAPGIVVSGRRAIWRSLLLQLRDLNGNVFAAAGTFDP